jgi:hypothetical protein
MTGGYLTSLVSRTLGPAEAIQPRLPTPFETPPGGAAIDDVEVAIVAEAPPSVPDAHAETPSAPAAAAFPPSTPPALGIRPAPPPESPIERLVHVVEREVVPSPVTSEPSVPPPPAREAPRPAMDAAFHTEVASAPSRAGRDGEPVVPQRAAARTPAPTPSSHARTMLGPREDTRPARARGEQTATRDEVVVEPRVEHVVASRVEAPTMRREPRSSGAPQAPRQAAPVAQLGTTPRPLAPPPEPVVHVTIGRVEIRNHAVSEPVPSRRPARAPALPLDEYLARRGAGT